MARREPRKLQGAPRSKDGKITDRGLKGLVAAIAGGEDLHLDDVRAAVRRIYESGFGIDGKIMPRPDRGRVPIVGDSSIP